MQNGGRPGRQSLHTQLESNTLCMFVSGAGGVNDNTERYQRRNAANAAQKTG